MAANARNPLAQGKGKPKRKRNLSPETRQKLSEAAKKRHQRGEFGGSEFGKMGGRPRKKDRVAARIVDALKEDPEFAEDAIEIFKVAVDKDAEGIALTTRMKALELFMRIESDDAKLELAERAQDSREQRYQLSRAQLAAEIAKMFTKGAAAPTLRGLIEQENIDDVDVVEGSATEVVDGNRSAA